MKLAILSRFCSCLNGAVRHKVFKAVLLSLAKVNTKLPFIRTSKRCDKARNEKSDLKLLMSKVIPFEKYIFQNRGKDLYC